MRTHRSIACTAAGGGEREILQTEQGYVMRYWRLSVLAGASALALVGSASARKPPSVSDIATCNQEAEAAAMNPSASPRLPEAGPAQPAPNARRGLLADRGTT